MKKIDIKGLNKKQIIIICVVAVLVIALATIGTISAVNKESPFKVVQSAFRSTEKDIIGKWQGEAKLNGYEFFEDGTYDSYISTFPFKGNYDIKGNKLTLKNPNASGNVVYRVNIVGDKMTLTLESQNDKKADDKEVHEFERVDHFDLKSLTEAIKDFADDVKDEDGEDKDNQDEAQAEKDPEREKIREEAEKKAKENKEAKEKE
ncbi:MAG: hypothetical protein IJT65_06155 [Eubacterium sp.]|nr:hypothetical protein [Eubacterium sp.]